MDAMIKAWRVTKQDTMLNVLPLHHVHGVINCLMTPLYVGGTVVMATKFNAEEVLGQPTNLPGPDEILHFLDVETFASRSSSFHQHFLCCSNDLH
jgi:malonyl-CoA/methylmalonyl-CoA synthetase